MPSRLYPATSNNQILLIKILTLLPDWLEAYEINPGNAIQSLFQYQEVQKYLRVNKYQESLYFHYESLMDLLAAFYASSILSISLWTDANKTSVKKKLIDWYSGISNIIILANKNSCKVYPTIEAVLESQNTKSK